MKHTHHITGMTLGIILSVFGIFGSCNSAQAAGINPLSEARFDVFAVLNVANAKVSFRFGDDFVSTVESRPASDHFVFCEQTASNLTGENLLLALHN